MIGKHKGDGFHSMIEGISIQTLCYGENTLMSKFLLEKGSILPPHSHTYEQTGYLISGNMILYIDEVPHNLEPGDSWCIPVGASHRADIIEDSVALEVFAEAREDYKKYL